MFVTGTKHCYSFSYNIYILAGTLAVSVVDNLFVSLVLVNMEQYRRRYLVIIYY